MKCGRSGRQEAEKCRGQKGKAPRHRQYRRILGHVSVTYACDEEGLSISQWRELRRRRGIGLRVTLSNKRSFPDSPSSLRPKLTVSYSWAVQKTQSRETASSVDLSRRGC